MRGAALAGAAMAVCLAACGGNGSYSTVAEKIREGGTVTVGTKWDQPGVGLKTGPGAPEGFDIDVARYIVRYLADGEDVRITWREAPSSAREALLQNGTVDMVVASYSITMSRRPRVTFAGPYVTAYQDTMVRSDDASIQKTSDLAGQRICLAKGSNSYRRIVDPPPDGKLDLPAILVPAANYSECVRKLLDRRLDAVSTENLSLAGYVEQDPKKLRLLNDPISEEQWAVGLKEGEIATCEAVNEAITMMWGDGTAARLLQKWFGKTGLDLPTAPPPPAGCP
ncbi:glutamate ABC transporter substrate-binding protein [Nonomuraea sp. B5E05]|uniref:glutamate ABC transporter substrate-binding protein n=1 Tax=Nonomuraea sp. B5E05 TaxID=3153569 RepID=UPI003260708F